MGEIWKLTRPPLSLTVVLALLGLCGCSIAYHNHHQSPSLVLYSNTPHEFVPDPAGLVVAGYPTVEIYHFAPVRIYRASK